MNTIQNPYKSLRVEFHILQSFPVTCLNRDDVGAPKTAMVGGSNRARVSSQCWKRQVRLALHDLGVDIAIRTKKVDEMTAKEMVALGASENKAKACSEKIAANITDDTLHFFTQSEAKALAKYAEEIEFDSTQVDDKLISKVHKKAFTPALDGLDIALFGRMVAKAADLNVEAAVSFSHALSTHKVTNEVEFFTALDDLQTAPGAAHMGSLEFNAATYYRYIGVDIGQLYRTLGGDEYIDKALEVFVKALYTAVPSARQTTQAGYSAWEFAKILVRKGQGLQIPFETAVKSKDGGFLKTSMEEMTSYLSKKEKLAGSLFGKVADFSFGEDENFNIDDLISSIQKAVKA